MSTPITSTTSPRSGRTNGTHSVSVCGNGNGDGVLPLTFRETEVLQWIAAGKRDREIGHILNISSRTAQKHVQHILEKLQVETRGAAAAAWYQNRPKPLSEFIG